MEQAKGFFTQKLGPLPLWGWAALALVALVGYWYIKKSGPFAGASDRSQQQGTPALSQAPSYDPSSLPGMLGQQGINPGAFDTPKTSKTSLPPIPAAPAGFGTWWSSLIVPYQTTPSGPVLQRGSSWVPGGFSFPVAPSARAPIVQSS